MNPFYFMTPARIKRKKTFEFASRHLFFADVLHAFQDYGLDLQFSMLGGVGAYQPFALSTERLDTPQKQEQFTNGFWSSAERGDMRVYITLSSMHGGGRSAHDFIHEAMHVYQDMYGLYFVPLKEDGAPPLILDANSDIVAILFCEAWAQVQTIRICYTLKERGFVKGWKGAQSHPDFSGLARGYARDMESGVEESLAAARCFKAWYMGAHREFYEGHALKIHKINFERLTQDVKNCRNEDVNRNLRRLTYPKLLERLPENEMTSFFKKVDWEDDVYRDIQTPEVARGVSEINARYGAAENTNIQDIKCGSPIYIWNRLRAREIETSEVPAELYEMAQKFSS